MGGLIEIGSTVPSHGAAIETMMIRSSSAPPTATVGWRRANATNLPRAVGLSTTAMAVAAAVIA
jgi:hypothetical protein